MKEIHLWGVNQNNLKNIEVKIPLGQMTVVCGPSGSGKSSLAFETLFAEGQRRFIESLSNYARQFLNAAPKPDIEGISNIPPSIAIEQKNSVKNSRSTVGTTTEIIDYIRILFEKLGQAYCPIHKIPTSKESVSGATDEVLKHFSGRRGYIVIEITKEGRIAQGKDLHAMLIKEGYLRVIINSSADVLGEVVEISSKEIIKKGLPKETFLLVMDRLSFEEEERSRIADSMALSYQMSMKLNKDRLSGRALIITTEGERRWVSEENSCPLCDFQPPPLSTKLFSFNNPYGACPTCKGFGNILELDEKKIIPNPKLSLNEDVLVPFSMPSASKEKKELLSYCRKNNIDIKTPWEKLPLKEKTAIWDGSKDFMGVKGLFDLLEQLKYKMHVRVFISRFRSPSLCPVCEGSRLRTEVKSIYFKGKTLMELSSMSIKNLSQFFEDLKFTKTELETSDEVIHQIKSRLNFLLRVGVHYLSLSRETRTLSGGEYQRLNLAHQLGMALSQALYVLDEPTVGLHPRDNDRLISILKDLRNLGNTIVVVEHDHDVIKASDHIIEIGPGSGVRGGNVVYSGTTKLFWNSKDSITVPYIRGLPTFKKPSSHLNKNSVVDIKLKSLQLLGATGNNLKNIDVNFPLNQLVVVTGVSGSGKSTLVTKTLFPELSRLLEIDFPIAQPCRSVKGYESIKNVILLDQSAIGRSLRSNILTFMKIYDTVRGLLAATDDSKQRGFTPGHYSLNVDGGRCPACRGLGFEVIDMVFMDNVNLKCEVCDGKKFMDEVLEVRYQGKNIIEIFDLTVEEGIDFFKHSINLRKALLFLKEVGLDYMKLGQSANSFSGGESQRLKIAKELSQVSQKSTLYILDEPTTGLHFREVEMLMKVLRRLIESGGSVIVVEHNLDVIAEADHIIDLGPEGGSEGGQILFSGNSQDLVKHKSSLTGAYLKKHLSN